MDIRQYLLGAGSRKPAEIPKPRKASKQRTIESSDEEDASPSKSIVQKNKTTKASKKSMHHTLSDSEDEVFSKRPTNKSKTTTNKDEKKLKPVTLEGMFDKAPIKRSKVSPAKAKLTKEEAAIHEDDDFDAVLGQLDMSKFDEMYGPDSKEKSTNGKRKKVDSEDETQSKKIKLNEDTKELENKKEKDLEKPSVSKIDITEKTEKKKLNLNNIKKAAKTDKKGSLVEVIVEKNKPQEKTKREKKNQEDSEIMEEHIQKKKQQTAAYQSYLHRGGARNPGTKTIPEGAPNCLAGLCFVITGVLESLEREEANDLIEKYGGCVRAAISKKNDYLIVGDEAGESKLAKAQSLKIKVLSEDGLLELIGTRPAGKASKILPSRRKKKETSPAKESISFTRSPSPKNVEKSPEKIEKTSTSTEQIKEKSPIKIKSTTDKNQTPKPEPQIKPLCSNKITVPAPVMVHVGQAEALTEKYRPKTMKQIIGQHGDKSCAKKFHAWLSNWHKKHSGKAVKQVKPSPWAKNDDGSFFKACLLSGPPGVGKTTTVQVVCNELGFDLLEFNASDTRSKRLLKEEVAGLLSNTTVKDYFTNDKQTKTSTKHVLLMDEVDGMAGNEDRGGLQELIALIKNTDIPIICICNDRNNPKMRTLSNYIFDLRFQKPKLEQIRGAMKSLCCREKINISTEDLDRLIQSTNNDIRQVINHLAMLVQDPREKEEISAKLNKDMKLGPWDVVRKVFSADEHKTMTIHDKSNLFFHDYNIAGLFVQENYLSVKPNAPSSELLDRVAACADSLSMGDQVESAIRNSGAWSLLPMQACYSSVIPGSLMSGKIEAQINFPSWLGRNSKRGKFDRLLQEITVHTRLVTGASKEAINIDYLKPLRDSIMRPLVTAGNDGIEQALNVMNHYHLLRDDLDSLVEISLWPGQRDPMQLLESKVKAAFTRAYNKSSALTPFAVGAAPKKKTVASQDEGFIDGEEDEGTVSDDEDADNLDNDRMIKAKKPAASKASTSKTTNKNTASTSKGREKPAKPAAKRGRGRGK